MKEETTRSLSKKLEKVRNCIEGDAYLTEHVIGKNPELADYLSNLISEKGVTTAQIIEKGNISKNYIYNILNGERKNPGRDKVIALCIGIGATFAETNRALELVRHAPLYPKDERDVRIAVAVNKGTMDVVSLNLILEEHGLEPLDV
ncbi:MAG: helix-turn-helix domain-containing protein [Lachnospiraceae bacterium]|nr:helix-turn-helix domain-containing protein [Lachnospiraceae bacterium]